VLGGRFCESEQDYSPSRPAPGRSSEYRASGNRGLSPSTNNAPRPALPPSANSRGRPNARVIARPRQVFLLHICYIMARISAVSSGGNSPGRRAASLDLPAPRRAEQQTSSSALPDGPERQDPFNTGDFYRAVPVVVVRPASRLRREPASPARPIRPADRANPSRSPHRPQWSRPGRRRRHLLSDGDTHAADR
jgi:hypothetical protein